MKMMNFYFMLIALHQVIFESVISSSKLTLANWMVWESFCVVCSWFSKILKKINFNVTKF